jgi:mitochondrial distribution and morphology protein 34
MSFTFKWPRFSERFHAEARQMLENALNKGNKPPIIADRIEVVELEMGTQASSLSTLAAAALRLNDFDSHRSLKSATLAILLKTSLEEYSGLIILAMLL